MRGPVYLAGAVEKAYDPNSWRDRAEEEASYIEWINPCDFDWQPGENDAVMIEKCKRMVRRSKGVLIRYEEDVPTWGTPMEQFIAWERGKVIVVWTDEKAPILPVALEHHADFIHHDLETCIYQLLKRFR